MFKHVALAAAAATAFYAVPASAAHVFFAPSNPGGVITLTPAGPGAVSGFLGFDVTEPGPFEAIFTFVNPFDPAAAGGSAVFNFDGDTVTFTGGDISGAGTVTTTFGAGGSSIQIDLANLAAGARTISIRGMLAAGAGGNGFATIGGQLGLQQTAAVPEPGTWALFILGFGAMGFAMRRRNAKVTASKATLNFA